MKTIDLATLQADCVANVERLTEVAAAAYADAEMYLRLRGADKLARATADELRAAQEKLAQVMADTAVANRAALTAPFGSISVAVVQDAKRDLTAISASYTITYERLTYDAKLNASVMQTHSVIGFEALPDDAYLYLVEVKPEALPKIITDLAPGDPAEAMNTYFVARRRGYMTGPATVQ